MLNYEALNCVIRSIAKCSKDAAWDAISHSYLRLDTSLPEGAQANWLVKSAVGYIINLRTRKSACEKAVYNKNLIAAQSDGCDDIALGVCGFNVSDYSYACRLTASVPPAYELPAKVVIMHLLSNRLNKGLSVEGVRKVLARYGFSNTSEVSRQVFTFITTLGL